MKEAQLAFLAKFPGVNRLSKIPKFQGKATLEHQTARSLCVLNWLKLNKWQKRIIGNSKKPSEPFQYTTQ